MHCVRDMTLGPDTCVRGIDPDTSIMSAGPPKSALRSSSSTDRVLVESHRSSHASKSAFVAILKSVQEHGLPTNLSRQSVKRARNRELNATTPLGSLFIHINLDLTDGGTRSVYRFWALRRFFGQSAQSA